MAHLLEPAHRLQARSSTLPPPEGASARLRLRQSVFEGTYGVPGWFAFTNQKGFTNQKRGYPPKADTPGLVFTGTVLLGCRDPGMSFLWGASRLAGANSVVAGFAL